MLDAIRYVLMIMVDVTQFDVAIYGAIVSEITGVFTVHFLLSEKQFTTNDTEQIIDTPDLNVQYNSIEIV